MLSIKSGRNFGMLTIIKEDGKFIQPSGQAQRAFLCKCKCGKEKRIRLSALIHHRTISCSCISGERSGDCGKSKIYNKWRSIKHRCYNKKNARRNIYLDRGIKMCPEWYNSYLVFKKWCLENGYKDGLTIDRTDNDKNYEPSNCRFVSSRDNCNNRRNTFKILYKGVNYPFMQLMRDKKIIPHFPSIKGRIKRGWTIERAIDTPIKKGNYFNKGYNYPYK
ncbi:MAG: hypothetical protein AABW56_02250 [Nanoarchaeota archaeon]